MIHFVTMSQTFQTDNGTKASIFAASDQHTTWRLKHKLLPKKDYHAFCLRLLSKERELLNTMQALRHFFKTPSQSKVALLLGAVMKDAAAYQEGGF